MSFEDFPKVSPSHTQSAASQRALEAVFCLPDFIARPQNPDYGKDYDVELCYNANALNVLFAVQLKSVETLDLISEGQVIAHSIETSRLNYLSQTPCGSFVVICDAKTGQLYYESVEKITQELDQKGGEWRGQETVTIHVPVANALNKTSAKQIHENVLNLHRSIQEFRSGAQVVGPAKPSSEPAQLSQTGKSQGEMLAMLASNGLGLVAGGLQREVLAAYMAIPSIKWGADARHLLTLAFAYEHSGLPLQSLSYANGALSCKAQPLPMGQVAFAQQLALIARFNLGQIESSTYYKDLEALLKSAPNCDEAKGIRLELIFHKLILPRGDPDHIGQVDTLVAEARNLVGQDTDWGLQLRLAKIELYAGDQHMLHGRMQVDMASKMRVPIPSDRRVAMAKTALEIKQAGLSRIQRIVEETEKAQRADVFAICSLELALHQFSFMMLMRILAQTDTATGERAPAEREAVKRILHYIDTAVGIFEKLGVQAQFAKALRLKADVLAATGDPSAAESSLESARQKAELAGMNPASFRLSKPSSGPLNAAEVEDGVMSASDDDLRRFAESIRQSISLPESRLENIFVDLKSVRLIHQEKRRWCKHLEILQDLAHTRSRETHYAIDPPRAGKCLRFGHETRISNPSTALVIQSFKDAYCTHCTGRET